MRKWFWVSAALLCAACRSAGPGAASHELRFAITNDPNTFDPLLSSETDSGTVRDLTSGVLLRISRVTDEVQPELAESYRLLPGGRGIAIHLRAGLQFSDGSPLTSAGVLQCLQRLLAMKDATEGGALKEGSPEIVATGPLDIEVRYRDPKPRIERLFDEIGITPAVAAGKPPATAGPFFVKEYHPGEYLLLARNPHYRNRPLPKLDSIRLDIQSNRDIVLRRFLRGELQVMDRLDPQTFDRVAQEQPKAARNVGASLDSEFLWFNEAPAKSLPGYKRRWFGSAAFRHGVSLAIHREDIVKVVYSGHAHIASGPISSANRAWFDATLKPLPTDADAALKSFASDGFALSGGVLRDREGHPVEFSLLTQAGKPVREKMAQIVADDMSRIGIQVNVVTLDFNALFDRFSNKLDYDAVLLGFDDEPDPVEQMNVWISSQPMHAWYPKQTTPATPWEARLDELEKLQAAEPSHALRKKYIDELQRIVVAQEPFIYLVNPDYLCAVSPAVKGLEPALIPPRLWWNVEAVSF